MDYNELFVYLILFPFCSAAFVAEFVDGPLSLDATMFCDFSANLGFLVKKFAGSEDFLLALLVPQAKHLMDPGLFSNVQDSQGQVLVL